MVLKQVLPVVMRHQSSLKTIPGESWSVIQPLITADLVATDLFAADRDDAVRRLAALLHKAGRVSDLDGFLDDVRAREAQMATGMPGVYAAALAQLLDQEVHHEPVVEAAVRANPGLVDSLRVEVYGSPTPIKQIASVSAPWMLATMPRGS
jgi:hypothetical protein